MDQRKCFMLIKIPPGNFDVVPYHLTSPNLPKGEELLMFNLYYLPPYFLLLSLGRPGGVNYSDLKLLTGLANAALTDWKLIVISATATAAKPASGKIHHCTLVR